MSELSTKMMNEDDGNDEDERPQFTSDVVDDDDSDDDLHRNSLLWIITSERTNDPNLSLPNGLHSITFPLLAHRKTEIIAFKTKISHIVGIQYVRNGEETSI